MLYLYDNAIADDLRCSFNPEAIGSPIVKVIDAEQGLEVIAQATGDNIPLPLVVLTRHPETPIDKDRMNFTRMHRGVAAVVDLDSNELYYEKCIPIDVNYSLTILAANSADRDELMRELLFKYTNMYFITFTLPYECKRKIRFGVRIDADKDISNQSGTSEYLSDGTVYESIIPLKCEGCVLVSYTPAKVQRSAYEFAPITEPIKEP